ncbi:hypothetical protein [Dictyobacter aurantiacus]|uniref:Uncharacterized protein n=1 Tax=Dictyobacter aurantiacus TaxID=1936993 RepID=A0A401ZQQ7_9CHLR|nr:hypothetical protein [Dictyobacter aurantiacus]GCE09248.1 hypothetical protein KDAU_65770 [Dictyobacter aurantiacus]
MGEEKIRLETLRGTMHIDIPGTAAAAGVPPRVVYFMLIGQPVSKEHANKVLEVLSTPRRRLTLENVDIVLWDDFLLLYCIRATDGVHFEHDQFTCVYAKNEAYARMLTAAWFDHVREALPQVYCTPIPYGLMIGDMHIVGCRGERSETP